ncbi:MAG TPA: PhnD/SsuA/transferrin family substrate-binding protein [Oligoflexus sp.]|uniref:phosphate/phosphite/phosphonate ABC transporter substrate-binding protein n=1 Tax=Oligoflexus sp. TaxID=1971216 RepID=UPI002D438F7E|nr:PhnD/SsuA/transferrin family substrate-binding protein [Oligoflexus sp.]HYX34389.1 PhnD/SsuA/transferrin family substrate-binding protein [Oligoflexus sp.]
MKNNFVLGAVAYAPKVVTIWEGFKEYFKEHDFSFDYVLFSSYEAQNEALFNGIIHAAWNSPLAWVRAERIGRALNTPVSFGPMRDSDQDLTSVLVARKNAAIVTVADLEAKTIGFGAYDSPQARLIPLHHLQKAGVKSFKSRCFDVLGGKHGDHIGGERLAAVALMQNEVDACWMIDSNYQAFSSDGTLTAGETKIIATTEAYDHCIFTMAPRVTTDPALQSVSQKFTELLMAMKWSDPKVRHLLELEGLKEWRPGRTQGFQQLSSAVDEQAFYDLKGNIIEPNYRY